MKKICSVLLCLSILIGLCACGAASAGPDSVVREFSEAMKKMDFEGMSKAVKGNEYDPSVLDSSDEITKQLFDYMKTENAKITYTLDKTEVNGDKGTVDVTYKYSDAAPIVQATMGDYFTKALGLAFGGASEEEMGKLFLTLFTEKAKTVSAAQGESKVTYSCIKTDGSWKIEKIPDEVTNILTCNIANSMSSWGDSLGNSSNDSPSSFSYSGAADKDDSNEVEPLEIEDHGFYIDPAYSGKADGYMKFCVMIKNPNSSLTAKFPKATVTVRAGDGSIIATETQTGNIVAPYDTVTLCGQMSIPLSETDDSTTIEYEVDCSKFTHDEASCTSDFLISHVSQKGSDRPSITGEVTNTYGEPVRLNLALVLRKDGEIVYIENTFTDEIRTGKTVPFSFERYSPYPEYDTIEVSAHQWL